MAPQDRFCTACGAPAGQGDHGQRRGQQSPDNYTARRFPIPGEQKKDLANRISGFLSIENYEVQVMPLDTGVILIQAAKKGGWRRLVGMKSASNILIEPAEGTTMVKIGAGKWLEKAATGAIGMLFFWPLAATTVVGAYEQTQLPGKIFKIVEQFQRER
ncbi:MAG: hypothetical protein AAF597_07035 [Bacteroidota bacterium]